jgi:hypothetical protein
LALILVVAALGGCSGKKATYPVQGKVLDDDDNPAAGALVVFHPAEGDDSDPLKPSGRVDDNGEYRLNTYAKSDGAPAGEYSITVVWPKPKKGPLDHEGADQLNGAYANVDHPLAHFTVEKGKDNEVPTMKVRKPREQH